MAKKAVGFIKLHVPGGQANPAPPVGPALGAHGVNIMEFCKQFNAKTSDNQGVTIPVEITAQDGKTKETVTVKVNTGSSDATLKALAISAGNANAATTTA